MYNINHSQEINFLEDLDFSQLKIIREINQQPEVHYSMIQNKFVP